MKLPPINRFQKQNYPGSADWFTRFIEDLNQFTETIWNILNKNITIADNVDAQVYSVSLKAGAAAVNNTLSFTSTLKHTPIAVIVGSVTDTTSYSTPLTAAAACQWSFTTPNISITGITGLTSGHTYNLTFIVF